MWTPRQGSPRNLGLAVAQLSVPIGILISFGSPVPQPTVGQRIVNQIDAAMIFTRAALRKCAYHFLRNAAASFLATHRSTTQISHNAIRNPTTGRSNPMSFQKDLAPPGIYDGTCAIAKSTSLTWIIDCSDSTSLPSAWILNHPHRTKSHRGKRCTLRGRAVS